MLLSDKRILCLQAELLQLQLMVLPVKPSQGSLGPDLRQSGATARLHTQFLCVWPYFMPGSLLLLVIVEPKTMHVRGFAKFLDRLQFPLQIKQECAFSQERRVVPR